MARLALATPAGAWRQKGYAAGLGRQPETPVTDEAAQFYAVGYRAGKRERESRGRVE